MLIWVCNKRITLFKPNLYINFYSSWCFLSDGIQYVLIYNKKCNYLQIIKYDHFDKCILLIWVYNKRITFFKANLYDNFYYSWHLLSDGIQYMLIYNKKMQLFCINIISGYLKIVYSKRGEYGKAPVEFVFSKNKY